MHNSNDNLLQLDGKPTQLPITFIVFQQKLTIYLHTLYTMTTSHNYIKTMKSKYNEP